MILAHRIALDPTEKQKVFFNKACGCARFAYNWALAEWDRQYEAGEKPTAYKLDKQFNSVKREQFPWAYESPKDACQRRILNLGRAFSKFFKKEAHRPKFKRKGKHDSFYIGNTFFRFHGKYAVKLPLIGVVKTNEELRFAGKILSGTISRTANKWFLSVNVDVGDNYRREPAAEVSEATGIDLGIKTAIVTSSGEEFQAPKPLKKYLKILKRRSRSYSRKQKGSNNQKKAALRLAKLHARISNIRKDWTHKVTTKIAAKTKLVCMEDLNVAGMVKNHKLARSINDVGFHEIRRQLTYKLPLYGHRLVVINRWLPTSKTCSNCGVKKDHLALSERVFNCDHCGFSLDRDHNAALNILAAGLVATACGSESSGSETIQNETCRVEAGTRTLRHTDATAN